MLKVAPCEYWYYLNVCEWAFYADLHRKMTTCFEWSGEMLQTLNAMGVSRGFQMPWASWNVVTLIYLLNHCCTNGINDNAHFKIALIVQHVPLTLVKLSLQIFISDIVHQNKSAQLHSHRLWSLTPCSSRLWPLWSAAGCFWSRKDVRLVV